MFVQQQRVSYITNRNQHEKNENEYNSKLDDWRDSSLSLTEGCVEHEDPVLFNLFFYRTNFKSQYYFSDSHNQKSDSYSISNINISY